MEIKTQEKCNSCRFFDYEEYIGFCRRHSPTIEGFPPTHYMGWCGDHEFKIERKNG
jgi:hypothetical protein